MQLMQLFNSKFVLVAAMLSVSVAEHASAQAPITFETLAPGTVLTNQFPGVVFSTPGGAVGASATIGQTAAGAGSFNATSSPTRFAQGVISGGDIPVALLLSFPTAQREVTFRTGAPSGVPLTVTVKALDAAGAVIPSLTTNIPIAATATGTINVPVTLTSASANIRSVQVFTNNVGSARPVVDDLTFCSTPNASDPIVSLTAPPDQTCVCRGSPVNFVGTLDAGPCGTYASDVLQYRSFDETAWTTAQGPFVGLPAGGNSFTGTLYTWTVPASLPGGWYYFRAKMYNGAGRSESDVVALYIDTAPPFISFTPIPGLIVRSDVCITGQVLDQCGQTFATAFRPSGGGAFTTFTSPSLGFPYLGSWPTATLPDGNYDLRVSATDPCGNTLEIIRPVTVDNTAPVARIDNVAPCARVRGVLVVRGEVNDPHFAGWTLDYTGGDAVGWVPIASGNLAIGPGAVIGEWDTSALRACGYTLRLRAFDAADNNCGSRGNVRETLVTVQAGCAADFDLSGTRNVADIFAFLSAWFAGCP
ncbi:MAG: hypothetical protein K2Q20_10640 [Phycisphaerales bacterium]|nr:hypothetical protein [Phycisphaerales bacterium]